MLKKFFRYFQHCAKKYDKFEAPITFRYKGDDSYSSWLGGAVTFVMVFLALFFSIWDFIPFCQRKNYSFYYYTINLDRTEEINLYKSKSSIAFNFECSSNSNYEKYKNTKLEDLIEINAKYIYYTNQGQNKNSSTIDIHNCEESDFYYNSNILRTLDKNKLNKLKCLNDLNRVIKNRYQDKQDNFTYYDLNFVSKKSSDISMIKDYLLDNDCKIELYYIDVSTDVDDYKKPIKPFLNEAFLQLDPDFHVRMNTYFMNEYFKSDNYLFFNDEGSTKITNLFSRTEQYFLHRGANTEENSFARIYIRADTRKIEIRRKYQTLLEFFADAFSFWDYLFIVFHFLLYGYNKMCLSYAISYELKKKFLPIIERKNRKNKYINFTKINKTNVESLNAINLKSQTNQTGANLENVEYINTNGKEINKNKKENKDLDKSDYKRRLRDKTKTSLILLWDYFWNKINICECNEKCSSCLCLNKKKNNLYYDGEKILKEKLDITYYINNILLFENIKNKNNYYYKSPIIMDNYFEKEKDINSGYNSDNGFYRINKKNIFSIKKYVKKNE